MDAKASARLKYVGAPGPQRATSYHRSRLSPFAWLCEMVVNMNMRCILMSYVPDLSSNKRTR